MSNPNPAVPPVTMCAPGARWMVEASALPAGILSLASLGTYLIPRIPSDLMSSSGSGEGQHAKCSLCSAQLKASTCNRRIWGSSTRAARASPHKPLLASDPLARPVRNTTSQSSKHACTTERAVKCATRSPPLTENSTTTEARTGACWSEDRMMPPASPAWAPKIKHARSSALSRAGRAARENCTSYMCEGERERFDRSSRKLAPRINKRPCFVATSHRAPELRPGPVLAAETHLARSHRRAGGENSAC